MQISKSYQYPVRYSYIIPASYEFLMKSIYKYHETPLSYSDLNLAVLLLIAVSLLLCIGSLIAISYHCDHSVLLIRNIDPHSKLPGIECRDVQTKAVTAALAGCLFMVSADKWLKDMG